MHPWRYRARTVLLVLLGATAAWAQSVAPPAEPRPQTAASQPADLLTAVDEFKLATRALGFRSDSPKRDSGGGVTLSSFHGRLYENFRNDILDAVPHEVAQNGGTKDLLRRNQYGFNVSGPVYLPKLYNGARRTFFSLNYEGLKERIGRSYLRTVPLLGQRNGDYNGVVDASGIPLQIYDPRSTQPNQSYDPTQPVSLDNLQFNRAPFAGRLIPAAQIDPVARRIVTYMPAPNTAVGPFNQNNYFVVSPETNTAGGMIGKIDHSLSDKERVSIGGSYTNGFAGSARYIPNAADPGAPDRLYTNRRGTLEHVLTLSPGNVNSATFEVSSDVSQNSSDVIDPASALGLSGVSAQVFPRLALGGFLPLGRYNPNTRTARNVFTLTDGQSLKWRKHSLHFVGQFQRQQVNSYQPASPSGAFYFANTYTSLPGIVNTGTTFGSFLLGAVDGLELTRVGSPSYYRISRFVAAASDTWEIKNGLPVSIGVTLDFTTPRVEKYNRQSTVDLQAINPANGLPGASVFAGLNGSGAAFQPVAKLVEPNVSIAWSPSGNRKSVARAAYARSRQAPPLYSTQWGTQGFNGVQTVVSQNSELSQAFWLRDGVPPAAPLPDLSPATANGTNAALMDRSGKTSLYQSASVSYEHEVPFQIVLSAAMGTAWGSDIFAGTWAANPNAISPASLQYGVQLNDLNFRNSLRPYPQYLDFDVFNLWPAGSYRRNNAWIRAEKRSSGGLTLNTTFEFSRQWDDYGGARQDFFNPHNEWSVSPWNPEKRLTLNVSYDLPFGTNKPFLNFRDWRRHLVDGWSLSDLTTIQDGGALAMHPLFNNTGGVIIALHVDSVPGVSPHVKDQGPALWFNPAAFTQPADFTLGNASRTIGDLRGPGLQNHDLSLAKRFSVDQSRTVEFTMAAFNVLNHATWNDPDTAIGSATAPNLNAGKITGSRGGRVVQLGLRLSF